MIPENDPSTRQWLALHTRSRHEFVADSELKRKGIDSYLPSVKRARQWNDRRKLVDFPVFPGYLFVNIHPRSDVYLSVLKTRGIVSFVSLTSGVPSPVEPEEIHSLRLMIESGSDFVIYPDLKEGKRVRVRKGPMKGAEGILAHRENHCQFLVNIEILGRSVGMKIYADDVETA